MDLWEYEHSSASDRFHGNDEETDDDIFKYDDDDFKYELERDREE